MRGATADPVPRSVSKRISIHAPHAGRDRRCPGSCTPSPRFQSTRPMRGATQREYKPALDCRFQSTRPVRARLSKSLHHISTLLFQSTRPVRARPGITHYMGVYEQISIHAPRAGATLFLLILSLRSCNFNPRAPCGRDLQETATCQWTKYFNPRAPCGRDRIMRA